MSAENPLSCGRFNLQCNDLADLAILWSKLADLGNLGILTLLADLADWKPIFFFSGHEV